MVAAIGELFRDSDRETEQYRDAARVAVHKGAGRTGDAFVAGTGGGVMEFGGFDNIAQAASQYAAAKRDYPYTAIRPVAVKIADLAIRAGHKAATTPPPDNRRIRTKQAAVERHQSHEHRLILKSAPTFVQKQIAEGVDVLDSHPILDAIEDPNPYMVQWSLMYCTAFSLEATGKALWWIDQQGERLRIWYIPMTWARPIHTAERAFAAWKIKPLGSTEDWTVPAADAVFFQIPDPADPASACAPLQTQARAVNTDEKIQEAQYHAMRNGQKPGMVLKAGRLPVLPGQPEAMRPVLTPEQRKQLISAIQLAYRGPAHHGEPIIVDGLIEDVYPYSISALDLDFQNGSQLTKNRIMQGIGTNPIVAGQIENANRASAYVAHDGFYELKVNPLGTLMSQTMTKQLGPRFAKTGQKLMLWIERAKARDADLQLSQMEFLADHNWLRGNEARESFDMSPDPALKDFPEDPPPPRQPAARPQRVVSRS